MELGLKRSLRSSLGIESGFYYLQSRYYDPQIGRFINADAAEIIQTSAQDIDNTNLFSYCNNNPVKLVDPEGDIAITTLILVGSILVGVAVAAYSAYTMRQDGYDWLDTAIYAIFDGLCAFATVYTLGLSAYGLYCDFCAYTGRVPIQYVGKHPIPQEAYDTYDYVVSHGGSPPPGYKGGSTFCNDGRGNTGVLPSSSAPYKEYDIHPKGQYATRGAERIVIGNGHNAWYTNNHYKSFVRMEVK